MSPSELQEIDLIFSWFLGMLGPSEGNIKISRLLTLNSLHGALGILLILWTYLLELRVPRW
ncbi:hypothetical protein M758_UG073100 [Ceratodon purpureus]|nr:hypothetical protein M758_UG073100 [Ceratodon purpureus]